ncbi:MAG: hypothetical protein MJZ38_02080 [archaeon]|nr:hypothetical protein [archaeon]
MVMVSEHGFEYEFLKGTFFTCSVCNYAWRSRIEGAAPRSCPGCGSRLWKDSHTHVCARCGHEWTTSRRHAKKCPSCQSVKWNGEGDVPPGCTLDESDRRAVLDRYRSGHGAVRISRELDMTFSDVFDAIREDDPEGEVLL